MWTFLPLKISFKTSRSDPRKCRQHILDKMRFHVPRSHLEWAHGHGHVQRITVQIGRQMVWHPFGFGFRFALGKQILDVKTIKALVVNAMFG